MIEANYFHSVLKCMKGCTEYNSRLEVSIEGAHYLAYCKTHNVV